MSTKGSSMNNCVQTSCLPSLSRYLGITSTIQPSIYTPQPRHSSKFLSMTLVSPQKHTLLIIILPSFLLTLNQTQSPITSSFFHSLNSFSLLFTLLLLIIPALTNNFIHEAFQCLPNWTSQSQFSAVTTIPEHLVRLLCSLSHSMLYEHHFRAKKIFSGSHSPRSLL